MMNAVNLETTPQYLPGHGGRRFKIGDTIRIRKPARFIVRDGQALFGSMCDETYLITLQSPADVESACALV